jgi:hypothetical protein
LDVGVPKCFELRVKEFCPSGLDPAVQHAYQSGVSSYEKVSTWSPPIITFFENGKLQDYVNSIRQQIFGIFDGLWRDPNLWEKWAQTYFPKKVEDFQTDIVDLLGQYFRRGVEKHDLLRAALSLLWLDHLLLTKFVVLERTVPQLEAHIDARRPAAAVHVIPDAINRFLKGVVLPMAEHACQRLTEALHKMLLAMANREDHSSATANSDLVLCLALILVIFLGRTQHALMLRADDPRSGFSKQDAAVQIKKMDEAVAEYTVSFHKYALSRRKSVPSAATAPASGARRPGEPLPDWEAHAREFDLVGRLRTMVREDYGKVSSFNSPAVLKMLSIWLTKHS